MSTDPSFADLDQVLIELTEEREFQILNADGKIRSKTLTKLNKTDLIALPSNLLLPGISHRS